MISWQCFHCGKKVVHSAKCPNCGAILAADCQGSRPVLADPNDRAQNSVDLEDYVLGGFEIQPNVMAELSTVMALVPKSMAQRLAVFPVRLLGDSRLLLMMERPFDKEAIRAVEEHTQLTVESFNGAGVDVSSAIAKYYR